MVIIKEQLGSAQGWIDEVENSWRLKWSFIGSGSCFVLLSQNSNKGW